MNQIALDQQRATGLRSTSDPDCLRFVESINDGIVYFELNNAVNLPLQHTRKKPLVDWLIRNR